MPIATIIAPGPSLTAAQCERAIGFVLAINRAWELAPNTHSLYVADGHRASILAKGFDGPVISTIEAEGVTQMWKGATGPGLCTTPGTLNYGGHGGYQALNLVYHLGFKEVYLLGFDFKDGPDGKRHFHGNHPKGWGNFSNPQERARTMVALAADLAHHGVKVLNCSPDSALTCFESGALP